MSIFTGDKRMNGKIIAIGILAITALFGLGMWYAQTRAYYEPITLADLPVTLADGQVLDLVLDAAQAIDADTSPLRFRACFDIGAEAAGQLIAVGTPAEDPTPLFAPAWFDCYDAEALGTALEAGQATAILATHEIARGVDRIIAVFPDGRGFAWHQLNGTLEN